MHTLNPNSCIPCSVRVPVLSNTITLTLPATFILPGDIECISLFCSLTIEYAVPIVIAAGSVGGTVMVTRISECRRMSKGWYPCSIKGWIERRKPKKAKDAKIKR